METASWRTYWGHDGMRPPKFHPNRSIDRRVIAFPTFLQYGGRPPSWILKILICDYVIVIEDLICCCVPNVNKIGSHVRPPDAHNCRMFNAPLLGNGRCHGKRIVGTCRGNDGMWPPKLGLSRSTGRRVMTCPIFSNMAAFRHFEF